MRFLRNILKRKTRQHNQEDVLIENLCRGVRIKKTKGKFLYLDWPFGGYVFDELKGGQNRIELIKFSLFDVFKIDDRRLISVAYAHDLEKYCQTIVDYIKVNYTDGIQGFLISHDWLNVHQVIVKIFQQLDIPTILLTHEGVFQNRTIFYESKAPISDLALVWGELHKEIFVERGFPANKIYPVGSIKLNNMKNFSCDLSREEFFQKTGLDAHKKTIIYCCQLCDAQWGCQETALYYQRKQIEDIVSICLKKGYNCIIRNSPAHPAMVMSPEFIDCLQKNKNVFVDGYDLDGIAKSRYQVSIGDSIFYSDLVIGMNTTVQLEAVLIQKPTMIVRYFDFDAVWQRELGLEVASDHHTLENLIEKLIVKDVFSIPAGFQKKFNTDYGYSDDPEFSPINNICDILETV